MNPASTENQLLYVGTMHQAGRTAEAETYIRDEIVKALNDTERWYYIWGNFHLAYTRRFGRAVTVLRSGVARHPKSFELTAALGDAYLRKLAFAEAADAFRLAVSLNPGSVTTKVYLALALEKSGKPADAEKVLRDARSVYPKNAPLGIELGRFLVRSRRAPDEGIKMLQKAVALDPKRVLSHLALGSAYKSLKRYDDALVAYGEALKLKPDSSDVRRQLAFVYDDMNQFAKAEKELQKCLKKDPADDVSANALGYLYAERSVKLSEAKRLLVMALKADPENGAYLDSMGWVLYKQGKFEGAVKYLKRAAALEADAVIADHLGDAYVKLGQKGLALEQYEAAVKLDIEKQTEAGTKLERLKAGKDPFVEAK